MFSFGKTRISSKSDLLRAPWDGHLLMCELVHRLQKQSRNTVPSYLEGTEVKTRRPKTDPAAKTLRVRYAELLRLREDVQRLAVSCQETADPTQHRAPAALIQQCESEDSVVPGQHFVSSSLPCRRREADSRPLNRVVCSERYMPRARQTRGVHSVLRRFDKSRPR
jgi:hypothetical protein